MYQNVDPGFKRSPMCRTWSHQGPKKVPQNQRTAVDKCIKLDPRAMITTKPQKTINKQVSRIAGSDSFCSRFRFFRSSAKLDIITEVIKKTPAYHEQPCLNLYKMGYKTHHKKKCCLKSHRFFNNVKTQPKKYFKISYLLNFCNPRHKVQV